VHSLVSKEFFIEQMKDATDAAEVHSFQIEAHRFAFSLFRITKRERV
jgi:hypothetical protein